MTKKQKGRIGPSFDDFLASHHVERPFVKRQRDQNAPSIQRGGANGRD